MLPLRGHTDHGKMSSQSCAQGGSLHAFELVHRSSLPNQWFQCASFLARSIARSQQTNSPLMHWNHKTFYPYRHGLRTVMPLLRGLCITKRLRTSLVFRVVPKRKQTREELGSKARFCSTTMSATAMSTKLGLQSVKITTSVGQSPLLHPL